MNSWQKFNIDCTQNYVNDTLIPTNHDILRGDNLPIQCGRHLSWLLRLAAKQIFHGSSEAPNQGLKLSWVLEVNGLAPLGCHTPYTKDVYGAPVAYSALNRLSNYFSKVLNFFTIPLKDPHIPTPWLFNYSRKQIIYNNYYTQISIRTHTLVF
jgi:hypothetical protein